MRLAGLVTISPTPQQWLLHQELKDAKVRPEEFIKEERSQMNAPRFRCKKLGFNMSPGIPGMTAATDNSRNVAAADRRTYSGRSIEQWRDEDKDRLMSIEPTVLSQKQLKAWG